ncbi:hypothetical protein Hte_010683 [Hypoxylon texense]
MLSACDDPVLCNWINSIETGLPPTDSPPQSIQQDWDNTPRSKRGAPESGVDTQNRSKKARSSHWTGSYASALVDNLIEEVSAIPPYRADIINIVEHIRKPLAVGKDGIISLADVANAATAFARRHHRLRVANETTVNNVYKSVLPLNAINIDKYLLGIQGKVCPLSLSIDSCADQQFREELYAPLLNPDSLIFAKPHALLGWKYNWVADVVQDELAEHYDFASCILDKIMDKSELWEFKSQDSVSEAYHQLCGAFAAALESGRPWLNDDNFIFGMAADLNVAQIYVAWLELGPKKQRYHYHVYRVHTFLTSVATSFVELQYVLLRIHFWAMNTRMSKIDAELRSSVAKEANEMARRLSGEKGDGETARGASAPKGKEKASDKKTSEKRELRLP